MNPQEQEQLEQGVRQFIHHFNLALSSSGQESSSEILPSLTEPAGQARYTHLFINLAENTFRDSLETIASTEGPEAADTLLGTRGNRALRAALFRAFHRRLCGDLEMSKDLRNAIREARSKGVMITNPTGQSISIAAVSLITIAIAPLFSPPVAVAAAPLIAGISLFVLQTGLDGFCEWARSFDTEVDRPQEDPSGRSL